MDDRLKDRLRETLIALMSLPGLSGHEDRVRREIRRRIEALGLDARADRLGNLIATREGDPGAPSVMLFAHMDQLGFVVRKVEADGRIRLQRVGGVPERALASQAVLLCVAPGRDLPGVIVNKSHHATEPEEKREVVGWRDLHVDAGFSSAAEAEAAGVRIGVPVVYLPRALKLAGDRIAGASIDDRAACAVLIEVAAALVGAAGPTVHVVFTVQEEFNLRGALPAAQALAPDIAIQLDIMLACDTPDMEDRGDMRLGGGPAMSLHSFHGRGTLNGVIPHPALVSLFETAAAAEGLPLQRSAQSGILTDLSYVQFVGEGVAAIDLGFALRGSHSSLEICDLNDLVGLTRLLIAALARIGPGFALDRDARP